MWDSIADDQSDLFQRLQKRPARIMIDAFYFKPSGGFFKEFGNTQLNSTRTLHKAITMFKIVLSHPNVTLLLRT